MLRPVCTRKICRAGVAAALLYAALAASANFAAAQTLDADTRQELMALRDGDMRKLTLHEEPLPPVDASFSKPDGSEIALAETDGKLRLLNFWATWCAPCRQEKPALDTLQADLGGEDFEVIAVATGRNSLEGIERFNQEVGVSHLDTRLDPESALAAAMRVPGLPVTLILNREGEELGRVIGGADWSSDSARAIVERLIEAD